MSKKKKKRHPKSILEPYPATECFACGSIRNLQVHHVFHGTNDRDKSETYGLKVHLCYECHKGRNGIHEGNRELDIRLKRIAQRTFEEKYGHERFTKEFASKNTLEEDEMIWK